MAGTNKSKSANQAAISAHPAFPAVVALWFAALLGLGSLVLPIALLEKAVTATGIASIWQSAAPPLGVTARLAIAISAALAGAAAGLFIARKVAQSQSTPSPRKADAKTGDERTVATDLPMRAPISAHEELGSEGLDEPLEEPHIARENFGGRRRALAVTDDSGPSDFFESAPLPGGDAIIDDHEDYDGSDGAAQNAEHSTNIDDEPSIAAEPLELHELALAEPAAEAVESPFAQPIENEVYEPRPFGASTASELAQPAIAALKNGAQSASVEPEDSHFPKQTPAEIPHGEREPMSSQTQPSMVPAHEPAPFAPPASATPPEQQFTAPVEPAAPLGERPLNELGIAELVERFAMALQSKSNHVSAPAAEVEDARLDDVPAPAFIPEAEVAAEPEPAASPLVFRRSNPAAVESQPQPEPQAQPQFAPAETSQPERFSFSATANASVNSLSQASAAMPAALRPLGFDDVPDDDDQDGDLDLSLSFARAAGPFADPAGGPATPVAEDNSLPQFAASMADELAPEEPELEDNSAYSSLLSMRSQLGGGQEFVRIDDDLPSEETAGVTEPVVVFPGQEQSAVAAPVFSSARSEPAAAPRPFDAPPVAGAPKPAPHTISNSAQPNNAMETERALREALEKLQRMSGAA
ncbi:hypothetical protein GRI43_09980 [Altererythrobacter luteolus]|uniref:Uncharacterized protein n=1 Tax=Pontixanthobacter luteolus TaxID=295089 RepID=A0A6I4V0B5_9SPHN|nr:hypothetical protein [Pontixanthobacter luteolus]MXP47709.1 hypothetical protein [Pontixanthobacter luteolus]